MTAPLLPYILSRQFLNNGQLASGAKIYTYASGTNTPKTTYKDSNKTIPNTNPIICDASGYYVCFLDNGSYRIKVTDQNDVQLEAPIDGVTAGGGLGSDSTLALSTVKLYQDLRNLTTPQDFVYVSGRLQEGDGGQGWFQWLPGSSEIDDGGITLVGPAGVFQRVNVTNIDPLWYGAKYNQSIDNSAVMVILNEASIRYRKPVRVSDSLFINTQVTLSDYGSWIFGNGSYIFAPTTTHVHIYNISLQSESGSIFADNVTPYFAVTFKNPIKLSWFSGSTLDDRTTRWIESTSSPDNISIRLKHRLLIDTTPGDINTLGMPCQIDIQEGIMTSNLFSVEHFVYDGSVGIFYVSSVIIKNTVNGIRPEWFSNSTDNIDLWNALASTGDYIRLGNKTYVLDYNVTSSVIPKTKLIKGTLPSAKGIVSTDFTTIPTITSNPYSVINLKGTVFSDDFDLCFENVSVYFTSGSVVASNNVGISFINSVYSAPVSGTFDTTKRINFTNSVITQADNVVISDNQILENTQIVGYQSNVTNNYPTFRNTYIDDIRSASKGLGTDSTGKLIALGQQSLMDRRFITTQYTVWEDTTTNTYTLDISRSDSLYIRKVLNTRDTTMNVTIDMGGLLPDGQSRETLIYLVGNSQIFSVYNSTFNVIGYYSTDGSTINLGTIYTKNPLQQQTAMAFKFVTYKSPYMISPITTMILG